MTGPPVTGSAADQGWMGRALHLARRRQGRTAPNPLVGAVLVKDGVKLAEGFHHGPGHPHAEAVALRQAGDAARGATLYVTLEPCCHTDKRTPPCAPAVIAAGVARVVIAMSDPNPKVAGGGIEQLKQAGIAVTLGCLQEAAEQLNRPFSHAILHGLPWLTLKMAQSRDGRSAPVPGADGLPQPSGAITGPVARQYVHRLRDRSDAVLVGVGTVLADDPRLTCRLRASRRHATPPRRVVIDSRLNTPPDAQVITGMSLTPTLIVTTNGADQTRGKALTAAGAELIRVAEDAHGRVDLRAGLAALVAHGLHHVLCEGGPTLAGGLLQQGLVNCVRWLVAPKVLGDGWRSSIDGRAPLTADQLVAGLGLTEVTQRSLGDDLLVAGTVPR